MEGFIFPHTDAPKNTPDFTFPNKDAPKTSPVLHPNLRRGYLRGVCNTPRHGYAQKPVRFHIFATRIPQKPVRFYTQTVVAGHFGAYAFAPYTGTCKIWQVLPFLIRMHQKPARFYTQILVEGHSWAYAFAPLHGYVRKLASFGLKPSAGDILGHMQYAPTRVRAKFGGFWA